MVMALKELSIRGDFRTTVEYLGRLLEDNEFRQNRIDTTWLDSLIADKVEVNAQKKKLKLTINKIKIIAVHLNATSKQRTKQRVK